MSHVFIPNKVNLLRSRSGFDDLPGGFVNRKSFLCDGTNEGLVTSGDHPEDWDAALTGLSVFSWIKFDPSPGGTGTTIACAVYDQVPPAPPTGTFIQIANSGGGDGVGLHRGNVATDGILASTVNATTRKSATRVDDGDWHFCGFTTDGTDMDMYTDGVLDNGDYLAHNATGFFDSAGSVHIGGVNFGGVPSAGLAGNIDQVAFWDKILTADEILEMYNGGSSAFDYRVDQGDYASSANLQGYWFCGDDTDSLTTVFDRSGNTAHLTPTNVEAEDFEVDTADFDEDAP